LHFRLESPSRSRLFRSIDLEWRSIAQMPHSLVFFALWANREPDMFSSGDGGLAMRVTCAVCDKDYISDEPAPHLCAFCEDEIVEQQMAEFEAKARAEGYASFEAYAEAQQRASEISP
jgi:hypothetical protein